MGRLPVSTLNVTKLANARAPEIEALYSIIKQRIRSKRKRHDNEDQDQDTQELYAPRNERRRTTCYINRKASLWKKRKRDALKRSTRFKTKEAEVNEDEDGANKVKKLSRRVRRRIELKGGNDGGYGCSRDGTTRLTTHVWHAKRFTMTKKWGYYLPLGLHGKGKGSRAVLKWSKSSALVHDASYYSAIQLEGPQDSLVKVLRKVLEPSPPSLESMSETSSAELCGLCYGTAMLHKVGKLPYGSIAPITYMWCPSSSDASSGTVDRDMDDNNAVKKMEVNNETRCLWIWIHAAAFNDAFDALSSACQRQNEEDGSQLVCFSRKHDLGRLDILGLRALELLQKILHPISRVDNNAERLKVEGSFKELQLPEEYLLANADKLPYNAVLSIEVHDPRDTPATHNKYRPKVTSVAGDDQIQQAHPVVSHKVDSDVMTELPDSKLIIKSGNEDIVNMPDQMSTFAASKEDAKKALTTFSKHLYNKALWSSQSQGQGLSTGPPLPENLLTNRRHQERLSFFGLEKDDPQNETFEIDQGGFSSSCPIILLKNDNRKPSACGWSIILPASWIKAFWIPLILGRMRAIGLRERRWLSCDSGLPSFPNDFPDCEAYWDHMNEEAAAYEEMIAARPPSKRPPSIFIPSHWNCLRRSVQRVCNVKDLSSSYITEEGRSKSGSGNVIKFGVVACLQNKLETSEVMRKEESNICLIQKTNFCLPGFVARTSTILKQHLRQVGGLHLLLFPELHKVEKKNYFHLMDEGQICWSLKGVNNIIIDREPCFVRVLIYAPGKGLFEDGAVVCAPKEKDFELWCSRSQGWHGLEIPPNLRNLDCIQQWMDNNEMMQIADTVVRPGLDNLRMPVGFVTTGACWGSVPALAVAMCEGTILGQLRAEQWKDSRWRKKSDIFVLVRNMKSTVYRPALASIVIEELEDKKYQ